MISALTRKLGGKRAPKIAHKVKGQATKVIAVHAKNIFFAPLYLYQGRKVKRNTIRLPEPVGARCGYIKLHQTRDKSMSNPPSLKLPTLNLMIIGDSAAAGVGSETQQYALSGYLISALQQYQIIYSRFQGINWSLQATSGHTSFDILRRLYVLAAPSEPVDVMIISIGVNDTTANVSTAIWRKQLVEIIAIAQRKFGVRQLIFCSLPQMAHMPALPAPLSYFIGAKAASLDKVLQHVCHQHKGVYYMAADFAQIAKDQDNKAIDTSQLFASDGFHPSSLTYGYWAAQLAELIGTLVDNSLHINKTI